MSHPPALLKFGEMVLGLVRAAELKEQDEGGEVWDDESRGALLTARALGLHGQATPVTPERVAELILQGLDLTIDQYEIGIFKVVVYPVLNPDGGISYSASIDRTDSGGHLTVLHTTWHPSKVSAWAKVHEFMTDFSKQALGVADLAARLGFKALAKPEPEGAPDGG